MLTTFCVIGGAILVGIGGVLAAAGGIMQQKQSNEMQKSLIDYEHKMLGRRDAKK